MSSLSSPSSSHEIFLYDKAEEDAVNGFVAGLAGSGLHDSPDQNVTGLSSKKRTIRLSANSGSYEEADYRISHPSITEELVSDEDSLCSGTKPDDMYSEFEMRLSDGSQYPSRFSLLNLTESAGEASETTLEVNNESTIDATLGCGNSLEDQEADKASEREGDSVFSPVLSSSFGDFEKRENSRHGSDSSIDSFGDFDNASWVSPSTAAAGETDEMTTSSFLMTSSHVMSREEVDSAVEECYDPSSPTSLILHSSPKKLLDSNFVWAQARSNVTKPSYTWDKLKLHSYLLGALSVRQPISLNRLKLAGPVSAPQKITSTYSSSSSSSSRTSNTSASPVSSVSFPVSPCDVELGELPHSESASDLGAWNSRASSPESRVSSPNISRVSSPEAAGSASRPSLTSLIHRKLTSHRRTQSSPIPTVKPASPGTRSLTNSPSIAVRSMTKSSSLECPLSPSSFDETHAGRGLSLLELSDIQTMRHEMKSRVSELSATLITEFQYRGDADHSKEVKKAFVSAFLTAEEKKSKGQLSSKQKALLPIVCNEYCPSTEILVLLTQLLNGLINDTPHTAELLKHYMYMLCRPCLDN
ncbi:hypothetical protein ACHWQZ_G002825 [Mnemiopsis leidyi]